MPGSLVRLGSRSLVYCCRTATLDFFFDLAENERENLRRKLFQTCGIIHLDLNLLLDVKTDDEYKEWRTFILCELENFVVETKHFTTRASC